MPLTQHNISQVTRL